MAKLTVGLFIMLFSWLLLLKLVIDLWFLTIIGMLRLIYAFVVCACACVSAQDVCKVVYQLIRMSRLYKQTDLEQGWLVGMSTGNTILSVTEQLSTSHWHHDTLRLMSSHAASVWVKENRRVQLVPGYYFVRTCIWVWLCVEGGCTFDNLQIMVHTVLGWPMLMFLAHEDTVKSDHIYWLWLPTRFKLISISIFISTVKPLFFSVKNKVLYEIDSHFLSQLYKV